MAMAAAVVELQAVQHHFEMQMWTSSVLCWEVFMAMNSNPLVKVLEVMVVIRSDGSNQR